MFDYDEIDDPYIVEGIADAISNHLRYMILIILRKHKTMTIGDLLREMYRKFGVKMTHGNIRVHLMKMAILGIIEMTKIEGKDAVVLKKDVKILVKEVDEDGK